MLLFFLLILNFAASDSASWYFLKYIISVIGVCNFFLILSNFGIFLAFRGKLLAIFYPDFIDNAEKPKQIFTSNILLKFVQVASRP